MNKILIIIEILIISLLTLSSPVNIQKEKEIEKRSEGIENNIKFNGDKTLDIYYGQKDDKNVKDVVIFIYGGAWVMGKKETYTDIGKILQINNYVAVIPDYIKMPNGQFDDMIDDIHKAIKWTYDNISKYGGNPKNIVIVGHSAGSQLVALTLIKSALKLENKGSVLEPLPELQKAILFNGPFQSSVITGISFENNLFDLAFASVNVVAGKDVLTNELLNGYKNGSVSVLGENYQFPHELLKGMNNDSIKSLGVKLFNIITSSNDEIVPNRSSTDFSNQLKKVLTSDTKVNLNVIEGGTHNTILTKADTLLISYIKEN